MLVAAFMPSRVACWLLVSCLVKDPWRYDDVLALNQQSPELGFGYQSRCRRGTTASALPRDYCNVVSTCVIDYC